METATTAEVGHLIHVIVSGLVFWLMVALTAGAAWVLTLGVAKWRVTNRRG